MPRSSAALLGSAFFPALLAALVPAPTAGQAPTERPTMVVIDASEFLDEIQKNHVIVDAAMLRVPWLFNNTGLQMRTRSNYVIPIEVPEAGVYHLYARTHGQEGSEFRVAIGDEVVGHEVGNGPLSFERIGTVQLPSAGVVDVRLMRIEGRPTLDVLVLATTADLTEASLEPFQLHPEVRLLREYAVPRSRVAKFGDLTGDGRTDFVILTADYSAHAYDHDGNELWSWQAPAEGVQARASFEPPGAVWDLDRNGRAEFIHWRIIDGAEWLVAADGLTGEVRHRAPWPTRPLPHDYNNFRLAIGRLEPGDPAHVVVFTDSGGEISVAAYDAGLEQVWMHVEQKAKDHLGHFVYPVDLTGDGVDEVVAGALVLDAAGNEIWNRFDLFFDHHDHPDSFRFHDVDGDGVVELVSAHSEVGVVVYKALTGEILWQHAAEHAQQVEVGEFLREGSGPHVAIGARTYGNRQAGEPYLSAQVWWFDRSGRLLGKWPGMPLNGNPVFVKGDWKGDGEEALFWYKFAMQGDGRGRLYFPDQVFHMFDFLGDAAEEVITLEGEVLRVYGYRGADTAAPRVERSLDYLRHRVANHTHY